MRCSWHTHLNRQSERLTPRLGVSCFPKTTIQRGVLRAFAENCSNSVRVMPILCDYRKLLWLPRDDSLGICRHNAASTAGGSPAANSELSADLVDRGDVQPLRASWSLERPARCRSKRHNPANSRSIPETSASRHIPLTESSAKNQFPGVDVLEPIFRAVATGWAAGQEIPRVWRSLRTSICKP